MTAYLPDVSKQKLASAAATRFAQVGEIEFCVVSILKFAPWVGKIFIVTDQQVPDVVSKFEGSDFKGRIEVIDHKIIFRGFEQYLPTFNNRSIATMLWRMPGLSEHFLYFNDDFFHDGRIVLRGSRHLQSRLRPLKQISRGLKVIRGKDPCVNQYVRVPYMLAQKRLQQMDKDERYFMACIQNLDQAETKVLNEVLSWLKDRVGTVDDLLAAVSR